MSLFRRVLDRAGVDDAIRFALLTRTAQGLAGAVTLALIAHWFSPVVQGFYYTVSSLLALQAFVELGMQIVIVNRASHEWSRLQMTESGAVAGERAALSRLASLARFVAYWYAGMAALFVAAVGLAGHLFLRGSPAGGIGWQAPWWTCVAIAALLLWLTGLISLLEGCNQVAAVNRFRFLQTIAEAAAVWLLLVAGAGLWVVAGSLTIKAIGAALFMARRYRKFFASLLGAARAERIGWRQEIWPMQWRLAAQGVVNYFMYSLFTPVMFRYHGPEAAGRMGMTLQIVGMVMVMGQAWVQTKAPRFGVLVAKRDFAELDRLWWRVSRLASSFIAIAGLSVWGGVLLLPVLYPPLAARVLDPLPTLLLLLGFGAMQLSYFQALYLRAHAREPYLFLGVAGGLFIGLLVFLFGRSYGATGAASAFLAAVCLFVLPLSTSIWARRRVEWQARESG